MQARSYKNMLCKNSFARTQLSHAWDTVPNMCKNSFARTQSSHAWDTVPNMHSVPQELLAVDPEHRIHSMWRRAGSSRHVKILMELAGPAVLIRTWLALHGPACGRMTRQTCGGAASVRPWRCLESAGNQMLCWTAFAAAFLSNPLTHTRWTSSKHARSPKPGPCESRCSIFFYFFTTQQKQLLFAWAFDQCRIA